MTIRSLRIFATLATYKNMTKTAEKLFLTQSSVSQVIKQIEDEYNVVLFDRLKNGLVLTNVGEDMLRYAKQILSLYDELESVLSKDSKSPKIRIGASVTVGHTILKDIISNLIMYQKNLDYFTFIDNTKIIEDKILSNEIDIAIVDGNVTSKDIKVENLTDDKMLLICSPKHRLNGVEKVNLKDIVDEPLVLREENSGSRKQVTDYFKAIGVNPNIKWSCSTAQGVITAVEANFGISVLSERTVRKAINDGLLWGCDIEDVDLGRQFKLIYHEDKFITKPMEDFINIAKNVTKKG